jgi:hypothetical protein
MRTRRKTLTPPAKWICLTIFVALATLSITWVGTNNVSANHPVLVEGNCDSPIPGTTTVPAGTCGDWDGDTRIGTAEDTDGADRIFGTLTAALGPGTGAAAGTGANQNGLVKIVASGRFAETICIGHAVPGCAGSATPGNVTLEAAPGVNAIIDAVLQGDPAGGNNTRQGQTGIAIVYITGEESRRVTLRNLTIRNWNVGIDIAGNSNVLIDNVRLENNLNGGIRIGNSSRMVVTNTQVTATGFRIGTAATVPTTGHGILINAPAQAKIFNTQISYSSHDGIAHVGGAATDVTLYKVSSFFNASSAVNGAVTICTDAAVCQ